MVQAIDLPRLITNFQVSLLIGRFWETEVWVVDFPEHMVHFNGARFMGPR